MKKSTWIWTLILSILNIAVVGYLYLKSRKDHSEDAQIDFWLKYLGLVAFDFLLWIMFKRTKLRKPILAIIIVLLTILFPMMFEIFSR
jgi:hypothetical protein